MPQRPSERQLRRLVVDLATFSAADIRAILSELEPADRDRVEALLREYAEPALVLDDKEKFSRAALSGWLAARASTDSGLTMTPRAIEAVHGCAVRLFPAPALAVGPNSARPSLFGRIGALFAGRAAP